VKLEYVGSGTSYMRLSNPSLHDRPEIIALVNKMFHHFFDDQPGHTFSLLYNAWAESNFGPRLSNFKESMHQLHADSGGLQMVTLAHKIPKGTDMNTLREAVYQDQSKWADVGMCFDEIPVQVITTIDPLTGKVKGSDRNDTTNRWFDRSNRHKYAKQTAENIKRQIEVFKATNSKCKPFMICQGGDLKTYLEWIDTILETVPKEDHSRIGGVAMGGAGLGTGPLEDIQKAFFASQVPVRDENGKLHLHILGVGAVSRMIPYLIFLQNGMYGDVHISYDSTTHTRAVETGLYYMLGELVRGEFVAGEGKTLKYDRAKADDNALPGMAEPGEFVPTPEYYAMFDDIKKYWPLSMTLEKLHEVLNTPSIPYLEQYKQLDEWYEGRTALCLASIKNFMYQIEKYTHDKKALIKLADKKYPVGAAEALYKVKDVESFNAWMKDWEDKFKKKKQTQSIKHEKPLGPATLPTQTTQEEVA